jgi:hypothetical protein
MCESRLLRSTGGAEVTAPVENFFEYAVEWKNSLKEGTQQRFSNEK